MTRDVTTMTDDQLQVCLSLIKMEINSNYKISVVAERKRFDSLRSELKSIREEIKRRQTL